MAPLGNGVPSGDAPESTDAGHLRRLRAIEADAGKYSPQQVREAKQQAALAQGRQKARLALAQYEKLSADEKITIGPQEHPATVSLKVVQGLADDGLDDADRSRLLEHAGAALDVQPAEDFSIAELASMARVVEHSEQGGVVGSTQLEHAREQVKEKVSQSLRLRLRQEKNLDVALSELVGSPVASGLDSYIDAVHNLPPSMRLLGTGLALAQHLRESPGSGSLGSAAIAMAETLGPGENARVEVLEALQDMEPTLEVDVVDENLVSALRQQKFQGATQASKIRLYGRESARDSASVPIRLESGTAVSVPTGSDSFSRILIQRTSS